MTPALTWTDLERIASECSLPLLVKGLLTAEDAALAVEHGAAGVVVSNHGGRQLDRALAERRRAAGGRRGGRRPRRRPGRRRHPPRRRRRHRAGARRRRRPGRPAGRSGASPRPARRARSGSWSCFATSSSSPWLCAACASAGRARPRSRARVAGRDRIFGSSDRFPQHPLDGPAHPQRRIAEPRPRRRGAVLGRLRQRRLVDLLRPRRHRRVRPRADAGRLRHLRPDLRRHRRHLRRGDGDVPRGRRLLELRPPRLQRVRQLRRRLGPDAQLHDHGRDLGLLRAPLPGRLLALARHTAPATSSAAPR